MGILNVTPDSFSDGGCFQTADAAVQRARVMVAEGASIVDVGGESTRPGSRPVPVQEELDRVVPVIERVRAELPVLISIDTSKPEVMRESVRAGAGMINDINALREAGALDAARDLDVPVCLMHMQGVPKTMQDAPCYDDVVATVRGFLLERVAACERQGIPKRRLLIDPGFGFGKTVEQNLRLLAKLDVLVATEIPVLVGLSRKSMIGAITGQPVEGRLAGGLAAMMVAASKGARILRVHDVAATSDAIRMLDAVSEYARVDC